MFYPFLFCLPWQSGVFTETIVFILYIVKFCSPNCCRVIVVAFHNLSMNCAVCQDSADTNSLKCNGHCGNTFHLSCLATKNAQYKNALLGYMNKIPNLRWFCDKCVLLPIYTQDCIAELSNRLIDIKSFADNLLTLLNPSTSTTQDGIEDSTSNQQNGQTHHNNADLNGSIATASSVGDPMELSPEKSSSHRDVIHSSSLPSTSDHVNTIPRGTKRPFELDLNPESSPLSKHIKLAGKQPISLADMVAKLKTVPATESNVVTVKTNLMRSIYITPFEPSIVPEDIMNHLKSNDDLKHIVPNIECTKLSSMRKNQRISFVSFKLDVPRHHYDIIVNPDIWKIDGKDEITIKDFIDNKRPKSTGTKTNPFSKPKKGTQRVNGNGGKNHSNRGEGDDNAADQPPRNFGNRERRDQRRNNQGRNFQDPSLELLCNILMPLCNRFNEHYEENRYGRRQKNRR